MSNSNKGYLYFPGCSLKSTGKAYEESFLQLVKQLEMPVKELPDWNCCGATSYMAIDERAAFLLSARNLSIACQNGGKDVIAPCSACFLGLRKTLDYLKTYPEIRDDVEKTLQKGGIKLQDDVVVRHPLEVLYNDIGLEKIRSKVTRKWEGGKIACYYGCQAVRPYTDVDDAHYPHKMDELLQAVGIPTVDYSLKTKCCGGALIGTVPEVGVRLNHLILKEAKRKGAEAIVTICPLCQFNMDSCQGAIRSQTGEDIDMPILYMTQVLGWAFGGEVKALGLHRGISGGKLAKKWFVDKKEATANV